MKQNVVTIRRLALCCLLSAAALRASDAAPVVPEIVAVAEQQRIAAIERASRATLAVFAAEKSGGGGSGVVISPDGYALTNFHVVQPCGDYMKCGMNDGQLYDAVVVGVDPTGDVALIKLSGRTDFPTAEMADSDLLQVGEPCFAVGNPFLLATDLNPTVTYGVISGVRRYQPPAAGAILEYTDCIQTDAAINPGNSGGPLFNAAGQLIGINGRGSFEKRGRVNVGVGYAISINQVKNFLGVLHSGRVVDHATLGATATTDEGQHVVVTNILESSDAYRRGLRYGDEIVSLAGRPIDSANTLKNVLGILPKGWRVAIEFRHDEQPIRTWVRLAGVHSPEVLLELTQQGVEPDGPPPEKKRPGQPPDDETPKPQDPPQHEDDPESPGQPAPQPGQHPSAEDSSKRTMPDQVARLFEERRGFANYYFNRLHRGRVWDALLRQTDVRMQRGSWRFSGRIDDQGELQLTLTDDQIASRISTARLNQDQAISVTENLQDVDQPDGSGGLYLAMHLWRRWLLLGPDQYGDVYYWGTAPLPERTGYYDVLVATYDVVETRLYVDPETGQLVALEMYPDSDVDPCELYFSDYRDVMDAGQLPYRIDVKYGDQHFGAIQWNEILLSLPGEPEIR
jgi:S1-C subfamily serine protease